MIGLIRHSETKVFNKALIQGSLIAYIVFMLFAWGGEAIFSKYLLCTRQISQNPYPIRVLPS